ncbi:MAG: hypothetical protein QXR34_05130 [Saccharolobus sp.]
MNFITFAEKVGIDRESAIRVYRLFNGGYFESLYYSKPPILYKIREWPKKYLNKKLSLITSLSLSKAFEALLWIDIIALYGASSKLIKAPMKYEFLNKNIEETYEKIREYSLKNKIPDYPRSSNLDLLKADFSPFIDDLVNKRMEEIKANDLEIINDIVYDSKLMEEIKNKYPWAKNIKRNNAIRAIQISNTITEFNEYILPYIYYLASSKTYYFDHILINNTLTNTIKVLEKEGEEAIKEGIVNNEYQRKAREIHQLIINVLNYF